MKHFHFSWMFWQNTVFLENFQLLFSRNNIAFLYTYFRAKIKKRHYLRSCWLWGLILGKITSWPNMSILNSFSIPSENERKIFFFYFFLHRLAPRRMKSGLRLVGEKNRGFSPPKDPKYFAQLLPGTPKIFFRQTCVYLLIGRKKFLAELPSGQIYKRLKKMLPK